MTAQRAGVNSLQNPLLQSNIMTNPNTTSITQHTITQGESWDRLWVDGQLGNHFCSGMIIGITSQHVLDPLWLNHRDCCTSGFMHRLATQSVSCSICGAPFVDYAKLQPSKLRVEFLLPRCVQSLIRELDQALLVGIDEELGQL